MKSKAPIATCALASIVALGATGYGFASETLFQTRQAVQAAKDYSKETFAEFDGLDDAFISGIDKSKKIVALDMDSIPDNLTTDKNEGSEPLYVEGSSGQQYAVTDSEGNTVYVKDTQKSGNDKGKTNNGKGAKSDISKSDLYIRYTVKRGDTLSHLSNEFGSSVDTLVRLNNINNPDLIYTDEVLHIPSNPPVIVDENGEVSEP